MSIQDLTKLDRRIVDRNVREGVVSKKDVESHIKGLPDDSANADWVTYDLEETELTESSVGDNGMDSDVNP